MLLEVLIILGLGTVELKLGVVKIDVLMGVCEVAGRTILMGVFIVSGMRRCWLTLAGGLTVRLGELSWYC